MLAANKENALIVPGQHLGKINAKTPGPSKLHPKTPYKIPLNDENVAGKTGKKALFVGKDSSLFATPIALGGGPRRPALTGKTTNAKAKIFTPCAEDSVEQQPKPAGGVSRLDASKRSIPEDVRPALHDENGEYPEIEYIPRCPPELPDIPDDFFAPDYDKLSKCIYKGCHRQFLLDVDESGKTCIERQLEESQRQIDAMLDAETEELLKPLSLRSRGTTKPKKSIPISSGASGAKLKVEKAAPAKQTVTKRPTSRSTSRPAPRSASGLGTAGSAASGEGSSTNTAVGSTALFSRRPTSSSSGTRPGAASKAAGHSRSISTSAIKKPLSFPSRSNAMPPPPPRPESRTLSAANHKTTRGHIHGKEVYAEVKRMLTAGPKETALEACERVLQEHEDDFSPVMLSSLGANWGGDYEDPVIMLPADVEEEFYIQVPE